MIGVRNYSITAYKNNETVRVDVSYLHEFSGSKITEFINLSETSFKIVFSKIKVMLLEHGRRFELAMGDTTLSVSYGGPDYQPIVKIFVEQNGSLQGISIPERECIDFIKSINL